MYKIPLLTAQDVECRIQQITSNKKAILLIYKDARVDMKILDKVFGPFGWQRHHEVIDDQLFCTVSLWDEAKKQWVDKQDVGVESNTEAEKGRASDSFKRACFNIGIGRELYNMPFICVSLSDNELKSIGNGKYRTYTKFAVKEMKYDEAQEKFTQLVIVDDKGNVRYKLGEWAQKPPASKPKSQKMVSKDKEGHTILLIAGKYYQMRAMSQEQICKLINAPEYAAAHEEARKILEALSSADKAMGA